MSIFRGGRSELLSWCAGQGFARAALLHSDRLPACVRSHPQIAALGAGTFLLAGLSCFRREPEDLSTPGEPHGLIAPFARRNYYREAVLRLRRVASRFAAGAGVRGRELRIFCNSRLPEKPLAAASGLGSYGKNALILAPGLGSLFVIAGMFLPDTGTGAGSVEDALPAPRPGPEPDLEMARVCGDCKACQEACPVGALSEPGRLDVGRCLQANSGRQGELAGELADVWGFRLYGCQVCQEVCPYNRRLRLETSPVVGELGPSLPLRRVLEPSPEELAERLRGTALGMAWISKRALQRNALLAAAHRGSSGFALGPALLRLLDDYRGHRDPVLARAASWALDHLRATGAVAGHEERR